MTEPEISVILTLHDQRVDATPCVEAWTKRQDLVRDRYEVLVMADGAAADVEAQAARALGSGDRLLRHSGASMMALYHEGARATRAPWLLFTEFHCIAEPNCLSATLRYLRANPELDGACLHSVGDDTNNFSRVERTLFEEQFAQWSKPNDWRKVMVRGVAIHRRAYDDAGGFDPRFAYFSDWVLSAKLHERGHQLGYAREASLLHYYNTRYDQFVPTVRARALEESTYRLEHDAFCRRYFGVPLDWQERRFSDRGFARRAQSILGRTLKRAAARPSHWRRVPWLMHAWLRRMPTALFGRRARLLRWRFSLWVVRARCALVTWSEARLLPAYLRAFHAIDRYHRLLFIDAMSEPSADRTPIAHFDLYKAPGERLPGFYEPEIWQGFRFRWCADVAFVETGLPEGLYAFELATIGVGGPLAGRLGDVCLDGRPAECLAIASDGSTLSGRVEVRGGPGQFQIVSRRLSTPSDERRPLGIAVHSLRFRRLEADLASR